MSEIWGLLPKAQDDSQTINQAINAAISAHNADSESHMGEGESIENHRVNDIIDHPQSSIPADKKSTGEIVLVTNFENSVGWDITAYSHVFQFSLLLLATNSTVNNNAVAVYTEVNPFFAEHFTKNLLMQTTLQFLSVTNGDQEISLSVADDLDNTKGFGFRVINGTLKGCFNPQDTLQTIDLLTVSSDVVYTLRCFVNSSTGNIEYWVNNILYGTIVYASSYNTDEILTFHVSTIKKRGTGSTTLFLHSLTFSRDV